MKLVDTNVLLYAVHEEAERHVEARGWLDATLSSRETVLLPWVSLLGFIRISTHPSIYARPQSASEAFEIVNDWLALSVVLTGDPDQRHAGRMRDLLVSTGTGGNLVSDAHLAALAMQYDATVISYDNDFRRFPGVRWQRPTAPAN
jgi:toxin-antitoxin system PIN domain toxin